MIFIVIADDAVNKKLCGIILYVLAFLFYLIFTVHPV